jgi:hypothetical protein
MDMMPMSREYYVDNIKNINSKVEIMKSLFEG